MRSLLLALTLLAGPAFSQIPVRIATYNIKFLDTGVSGQGDRLSKLREVVQLLEADIIGLQEIKDRAALNLVFPPAEWRVVIDDDSGDDQDVALAVRKPWAVPDFTEPDLDADDQHFLFPGSASNSNFLNRRDVLAVRVRGAEEGSELVVMVVHAKSRFGGRALTEARRVGAARDLVQKLQADYDETRFVLLEDFNDNPDDQSLNILETGQLNAPAGPEQINGPFLANLTESLLLGNHVSHRLNFSAVIGDDLMTVDAGSRDRNNSMRGTDQNTGNILFDQILIPAWMTPEYVPDSVQVFSHGVAATGNNTTRASDHVPVFADFVLMDATPPDPDPTTAALRITTLLPNPHGADDFHEQVTLHNGTAAQLDLTGWKIQDAADNSFAFAGAIPAGSSLTVTMTRKAILNNTGGDTVRLTDPTRQVMQTVEYGGAAAQSGATVTF